MATVPYDLCTFAVDEQTEDDIIFTSLASREITIESGTGWVEEAPGSDITATIQKDGVEVAGSSLLIESDGTVTITIPDPFVLASGETLQITLNSDANIVDKVVGVGITFKGTIETDNEDPRYDISFFIEGKVPGGRTIAAAIIPRQMHITSTGFQIKKNTEQQTGTLAFFIRKNGTQIGSIISNSTGSVSLLMNDAITNFEEGDVFSIFAPGSVGSLMDNLLADISITFRGFLGIG